MKKFFFLLYLVYALKIFSGENLPDPTEKQQSIERMSTTSENMVWRKEPYALLLIQHAHDTKRFEEKKEYLEKIALRLNLTIPQAALSRESIDTTISNLFLLFYPTSVQHAPSDLVSSLQSLFPPHQKPSNTGQKGWIDILEELHALDKKCSPSSQDNWEWIQLQIDCMSLDLLPLTRTLQTDEEKIEAINWYLFFLKGIRYPPLKEAFQMVDHYSSLGTTLSSQQGICLGTTILYAALCQNMGLSLAIFTPPGHIFPALVTKTGFRAIETTARGSHVPFDRYETIDEPHLTPHTLNILPLSYLENKAASMLASNDIQKALDLYLQCEKMDGGVLAKKMIPLCFLLLGDSNKAREYAQAMTKEEKRSDFLIVDIENNHLSQKSALSFFDVLREENPFSIRKKLPDLLLEVEKSPQSLSLRYHAALLLFQEHRAKEAQDMLERAPQLPPNTLHWTLLKMAIVSHLHNSEEELSCAIELLQQALKQHIFSCDIIEPCLSIYRKNPDCKELSSLLQQIF